MVFMYIYWYIVYIYWGLSPTCYPCANFYWHILTSWPAPVLFLDSPTSWIDYEESPFKNLHCANFQGQMLSFISPSSNFAPQAANNNNNNNNTDKFPVKTMFFRVLEPPQAQYSVGKSSGVIEALRLLGTAGLASVFGLHFGRHRALQNIPDFFPSSKMGWLG